MVPNPSNDPEYRHAWHKRRRRDGVVMLQAAVPVEFREFLNKQAKKHGISVGRYLQQVIKRAA